MIVHHHAVEFSRSCHAAILTFRLRQALPLERSRDRQSELSSRCFLGLALFSALDMRFV